MGSIEGSVEASLLILTVIIIVGPLFAERFAIPGLVGLILGGMVVGPFMFGWESLGGLISALGSIGILYLMFVWIPSIADDNKASLVTYALMNRSGSVSRVLISLSFPRAKCASP